MCSITSYNIHTYNYIDTIYKIHICVLSDLYTECYIFICYIYIICYMFNYICIIPKVAVDMSTNSCQVISVSNFLVFVW